MQNTQIDKEQALEFTTLLKLKNINISEIKLLRHADLKKGKTAPFYLWLLSRQSDKDLINDYQKIQVSAKLDKPYIASFVATDK